jgi:hypothetical protein
VIVIIGVVLIIIDFFIHLLENLGNGMDIVSAITTALGQTFADVANVIIGIINAFAGFLGYHITPLSTASGFETAQQTKAVNVVNNINFNKNVSVGDGKTVQKIIDDATATSMG